MELMKLKKFAPVIGGIVVVLALLWYFQEQGFVKIFPTGEDRRINRILKIDESRLRAAEGLTAEQFNERLKDLYAKRDKVRENPRDAQAWFLFGSALEFLNDHERAALAWEEAFALQTGNFVVAGNLGNTYQYFLKNYERAEFYYQRALEAQPNYTAAYLGLADLYRFNLEGREDDLEPLLLRAAYEDQASQLSYYSILVEFFAERGEISKAKDYLARVRLLKPAAAADLVAAYPSLK